MTTDSKQKIKTLDMVYIAVFAVLIAICTWISIPAVVPFTMQTFAIFLTVGVLGGKRGSLAILIYLLLGAIGMPVFSGFQSGISAILGKTGGYRIYFFGSYYVGHGKAVGEKDLGIGSFHGAWNVYIFFHRNNMVYGSIRKGFRCSGADDSFGMVCFSLCYS